MKWIDVLLLFGAVLVASENPDSEFPYYNDLIAKIYQNKIAAKQFHV